LQALHKESAQEGIFVQGHKKFSVCTGVAGVAGLAQKLPLKTEFWCKGRCTKTPVCTKSQHPAQKSPLHKNYKVCTKIANGYNPMRWKG
jgi:hypothetical protein